MNIPETWTFKSGEVADNFDTHVREQLPWYDMATDAVAHVVRHYLPRGGLTYDVGASTGNIGRAVEATVLGRNATFIAVEESAEMAAKYQGPGTIVNKPAQAMAWEPFDVATLFLVLMFLPVSDRAALVTSLRSRLRAGGVIIVIDKVLAPSGYFGTVLRRLTMDWKIRNGATPQDIVAKELSWSGIQRPIAPRILGDEAVCFFTFGEFAGWIIEKPE